MIVLMSGNTPQRSPGEPGGLRPTRTPAPRPWRRPAEPDLVSDRLGLLIHELAGLVDGSRRHVGMALREVNGASVAAGQGQDVSMRLRTVQAALEKMADAIRHAAGAPPMHWLQAAFNASLADAVHYAVGIMEPVASDRCITMNVDLPEQFTAVPPGHIYTVVVNAIRNSIESIVASGEHKGSINISGWLEAETREDNSRTRVCIEVSDTGLGPPPLPEGHETDVFEHAFSTKPGGLGIGLAVSRQIVEGAGGTIELRAGRSGVGATLAISYPMLDMECPAPPPG